MPRNKFEQKTEKQLKKAKVTYEYETEHIPYLLSRHYIPDFIIHTSLGKVYVECKGYLRPEHKSKMVAVKKLNPHLDIRILFYSNKPKDIKWADRHNFKWAISIIPDEWLQGL